MTSYAIVAVMNWNALRDKRCPQCGDKLNSEFHCRTLDCNFKTTKQKFQKIVETLYKPQKTKPILTSDMLHKMNNFDDFPSNKLYIW